MQRANEKLWYKIQHRNTMITGVSYPWHAEESTDPGRLSTSDQLYYIQAYNSRAPTAADSAHLINSITYRPTTTEHRPRPSQHIWSTLLHTGLQQQSTDPGRLSTSDQLYHIQAYNNSSINVKPLSVHTVNKKTVLLQGKCTMQCVLVSPNDCAIAMYIQCIKADLNVKL